MEMAVLSYQATHHNTTDKKQSSDSTHTLVSFQFLFYFSVQGAIKIPSWFTQGEQAVKCTVGW
jgi:hypothetical protein